MDKNDREAIEEYAAGDLGRREDAIAAYRRGLGTNNEQALLHMQFMAEVDNGCPDLGLRFQARQKLLNSVP